MLSLLDRFRAALPAVLFVTLAAAAAPSAIGIITASGHFTLEHSQVWGNSTLFDGSTVETGGASSELMLNNGVKLQLAAGSRARVWQDHLAIEKGVGQVSGSARYAVEALGLRISAASSSSQVRVGVSGGRGVQVAALAGSATVTDSAGIVMADVATGRTFYFEPQAAGTTVTRSGCVVYRDNKILLQDENSGEVVELQGQKLAQHVGNRVSITGSVAAAKPSVPVARSVIQVVSVTPGPTGGCLTVASELGAQTTVPSGGGPQQPAAPAPKPEHHGMSTGAKAGILLGIAGGAGGAAIALSQSKKSTSP